MINQINISAGLAFQPDSGKKAAPAKQDKKTDGDSAAYTVEISADGKKSGKALSSDEIESLKDQADAASSSLKDIVEKLIVRQNKSDVTFNLNIQILTASSEKSGLADISQDSDWGIEAVSDRIVDFAKSLSGGDKSKLETLREAIDKGFSMANKTLGGKLPDVSMKTYDAVMQKLDDWAGESNPNPTEA